MVDLEQKKYDEQNRIHRYNQRHKLFPNNIVNVKRGNANGFAQTETCLRQV